MDSFASSYISNINSQVTRNSSGARGLQAARSFEANLIASMLESMEKSFSSLGPENNLAGGDDYRYIGIQALAERMAADGGFGIAAMIAQHLPHEGKP